MTLLFVSTLVHVEAHLGDVGVPSNYMGRSLSLSTYWGSKPAIDSSFSYEYVGLLLTQLLSFVDRVMRDVEKMAYVAQPNPEQLRMKYPPIGCWAPTCAL